MCALLINVFLVLGKNRDELLQLIIYKLFGGWTDP